MCEVSLLVITDDVQYSTLGSSHFDEFNACNSILYQKIRIYRLNWVYLTPNFDHYAIIITPIFLSSAYKLSSLFFQKGKKTYTGIE